jgi:N-acetylmuramoyl-L-alanine amidase
MDELVHRTVPSPNWDDRKLPISMVVLHYTEMASAEDALARLTDPEAKVSAHYLISEAGEVIRLVVQQYDVPRANVVGHSDVAPARKIDPGELFPWDRLAEYKLCLERPTKLEQGDPFDNDAAFYLALERFGYDVTDGHKAVEAFQRRWRPDKIDGQIDGQVRAILFQLLLDRDQGRAR